MIRKYLGIATMKTDTTTNSNQTKETPVLHESNLPVTKKPSFLFIASTSAVIIAFLLLIINGYYGLFHF